MDPLKVAIQAVEQAGNIQRRHFGEKKKVESKGERDLVTEIDRLCDDQIKRIILSHFPDHSIISEEGSVTNSSQYRWIIDPLDGTLNYAHGYPFFCVSVALEMEGKTVLGAVYDSMRDELFWAEEGRGAYLNGKRITVSKVTDLKEALLAVGFPKDYRSSPIDNFDHFRNLMLDGQAVRRDGSMVLDLCYVAMGRLDGFWALKLDPWDVAAGKLIVEEAGGLITDFDGNPISPGNPEVAASNALIHKQMINVLKRGKRP